MVKAPSPAFSLYPKDVLSDERCRLMTNTEFGVYMRLLCHAWLEGSIPDDTVLLARLVGMKNSGFNRAWRHISPCFERNGDRLVQVRLERQRELQLKRSQVMSENGSRGGRPRKDRDLEKPKVSPSFQSAKPEESFPSSSSFALQEKKETDRKRSVESAALPSEKTSSERVDMYSLRDAYNEEVSKAFGAATDLRFNGDPGNLSTKQIDGIRRQVNGHSVDEARLVVQRAIEDPWWNGKKDGTSKIGFTRIMYSFESILARGGGKVEIEKPKQQPYVAQRPKGLLANPETPEDLI